MAALLNEPDAEDALREAVSSTTSSSFLELIQRAVPIDVPTPVSVMHAVRNRLSQPDLSRDLERGLLKLRSRDLARCYFAAEGGDQDFEQLAQTAISDAMEGRRDLQRRWIFSL